jgi:hypothetical protein
MIFPIHHTPHDVSQTMLNLMVRLISDGTDTELFIPQKIENFDYKVVSDLCGVVNHDTDKETHLVDLLAAYFDAVGKTSELLQWAIQWEVAKTGSFLFTAP